MDGWREVMEGLEDDGGELVYVASFRVRVRRAG